MATTTDLTIAREIVIDAPIDVVWRTITEPAQITEWFADRVVLDVRPGAEGELVFEPAGSDPVTAPVVVETVEAPHHFAFRWGHPAGAAPDATNSVLVRFTLVAEQAGQTRLRVVEQGLESVLWSAEEKARYAADHREGWAFHLGRLVERFATSTA